MKLSLNYFLYRAKLLLVDKVLDRNFKRMSEPSFKRELHHDKEKRRSKKICLFAHWDPDGVVDDYVFALMEQIQNQGEFDIAFCTTAKGLDEESVGKLKDLCFLIVIRSNEGIDFGSWCTLLRELDRKGEAYQEVLFANDSVYGPIFDLKPTFEKMERAKEDLVGIINSWEHHYHLQSYFLLFKERAIKGQFFKKFKSDYNFAMSKRSIIWKYEIGFTQRLMAEGLKAASVFEIEQTGERLNPTIENGLKIISEQRFPFLKRMLFMQQTFNGLDFLESKIAGGRRDNIKLISKNIKRYFRD